MSEDVTLDEFADSEEFEETDTGKPTQEIEKKPVREMFGIGRIPRKWSIQSLADSAKIIAGNSPPSSTYNEKKTGLPFFQGNAEFGHFHPEPDTWCSEPRKVAEPDDILISIRAPVGDLNIADQRCCIGRGLAALRPDDTNRLYLYYHLTERKNWLSRLATGSTFNSVTKGDLQNLDIPLPPLSEQRKIATVLHTVDQAIQKTGEIIERTKRLEQGLMQDLFRRGVEQSETKELRRVGEVPQHWEVVTLGNVCTEITDGTHKSPSTIDDGYPYVTSQNIRDWGFDLSDLKYIAKEDHERITSRCNPEANDVLYVKDGANTGNVNVNTLDFDFSLLSSVALIKPDRNRLKPWFLKYLLSWSKFRQLVLSQMSGTGISRLTISKLEKTDILLPPIEEQERIVEILDTYYEHHKNQREYRDQLKSLKQGLMQELLSGKVRTTDVDIDIPEEVAKYD